MFSYFIIVCRVVNSHAITYMSRSGRSVSDTDWNGDCSGCPDIAARPKNGASRVWRLAESLHLVSVLLDR